MKEKWRLIKSVVTLSLVAFLLVFAIFTYSSSFAWMARSTDVSAKDTTITANDDSIIKSIKYYRITDTVIETSGSVKKNVYKFGFNENVLKTQYVYGKEAQNVQERTSFEQPIGMRPYSELSADCQILIEITLLSGMSSAVIEINGPTNKKFLGTTISEKISGGIYDLQPTNLPLSSIVHFAVFSSLSIQNEAFLVREAEITNEVCLFKGNATDGYVFDTSKSDIDVEISKNSSGEYKFFILFDYKSELVEYINDQVIDYVDKATAQAKENNKTYETIILGETNLCFVPDFQLKIRAGAN